MAKQKNTDNKKLHSKLLGQKTSKEKAAKELHKKRIRELNQLANLQKNKNLLLVPFMSVVPFLVSSQVGSLKNTNVIAIEKLVVKH